MPRFSFRRLLLYFLAVSSGVFLLLNHHGFQVQVLPPSSAIAMGVSIIYKDSTQDQTEREAITQNVTEATKPWYMKEGGQQPETVTSSIPLFPKDLPESDRIHSQLMYVPQKNTPGRLKKILLWNNFGSSIKPGRSIFLKEQCPINSCSITLSRTESRTSDLVIFKDHFVSPTFSRPPSQLWMMYMLECPLHTQIFKTKSVFNWTATYRADSTIVAPYEKWEYYDNAITKNLKPSKDYSNGKTKTVAWFVSNCGARNGRLQYAKELQKYIQVDIYGSCGTKHCPRTEANSCFKMLEKDYKFYLAFENSNCKDYITEKFFVNGLGHDILPIVMGARPEDYERSAPKKSYIHVEDFANPKELAEFLKKLDKNNDLYNEYFEWKGTGEFINTKFFCRVCSLLHHPKITQEQNWYQDINDWWRAPGTCINGSWKKFKEALIAQNQSKSS